VIPTSAVQRGPAGTFSYVINDDETVTAKPVVVTQQSETDAVIASGLSTDERVVTTGFANLSDGAKVTVGNDDKVPTPDLAPKRRGRRDRTGQGRDGQPRDNQAKESQAKDGQAKDTQAKDSQVKDGEVKGEHRHRRHRDDGDEKAPAQGNEAPAGAAKSQP
jgi:multidrug efflux system membrane fusion protein